MKGWMKLLLGVVAIGLVVWGLAATGAGAQVREWLQAALAWIEGLGFWGPLIFIVLYVVAAIFMVKDGEDGLGYFL